MIWSASTHMYFTYRKRHGAKKKKKFSVGRNGGKFFNSPPLSQSSISILRKETRKFSLLHLLDISKALSAPKIILPPFKPDHRKFPGVYFFLIYLYGTISLTAKIKKTYFFFCQVLLLLCFLSFGQSMLGKQNICDRDYPWLGILDLCNNCCCVENTEKSMGQTLSNGVTGCYVCAAQSEKMVLLRGYFVIRRVYIHSPLEIAKEITK